VRKNSGNSVLPAHAPLKKRAEQKASIEQPQLPSRFLPLTPEERAYGERIAAEWEKEAKKGREAELAFARKHGLVREL
jgi:hypothetical protein